MSANSLAGKGLKTLFKSVSFTLLGRHLFVLFCFCSKLHLLKMFVCTWTLGIVPAFKTLHKDTTCQRTV